MLVACFSIQTGCDIRLPIGTSPGRDDWGSTKSVLYTAPFFFTFTLVRGLSVNRMDVFNTKLPHFGSHRHHR